MHLLITGGLGYVGSYLAECFRRQAGVRVTLLARCRRPDLDEWRLDLPLVEADVTQPETLRGCCAGVDVVLHLAAANEVESERDPERALRVNAWGTWNMWEESRRAGVKRFLYFSTFHVYGHSDRPVLDENTEPRPASHYALTHRVAELYLGLAAGPPVVILRVSNGYGAPVHSAIRRWTLVVNDLCRQAVSDQRLVLRTAGTQKRDFVSLEDVFQATRLLLAPTTPPGVYNVGGDKALSIREVAERVASLYRELYGKEVHLEAPSPKQQDLPPPLRFRIGRLRALGYRPSGNLEEQIRLTLRLCQMLR